MFKKILEYYYALNICNKLKFLGISSAIISGTIILSLVYIFEYMSEKKLSVKESNVFANILAENIVPSVISEDILATSDTLASIEYNKKIFQTFAFDISWKMLGAYSKGNDFSKQREIALRVKENQNLWKDGYYYAVVPMSKGDIKYGYIVVVYSLEEFYSRMIQYSIVIILIILAAMLITSRFRKILQRSILEPIAVLDNVTTEIIRTKNLKYEFPNFNNDEIGILAKNFQEMVSELNIYHDELNEQKNVLDYQANHDTLTKLPNRSFFQNRLQESVHIGKRYADKFAVFFIDLDQFKEVNDTFGHEYGDKLLVKVAARFKSILRENDTLARLGGDEFVIIMRNLKEYHVASVLAQKVLDILEIPMEINEEEIFVSASVGISLYPQDSQDQNELLKYADIAMYRSKEEGRNRYHFYAKEMSVLVNKRVEMQSRIRAALEEKEFIVHYQPQYNMVTNKIIGTEALVRWKQKDGTLVFPGSFIDMAEDFGMVVAINRQVMASAMMKAKEWHDQNSNFGRVSINISIEQIEDENFVGFMQNILFKTACSPQWIALELVEGQIMKNPEMAVSILKSLSDLGLEIVVDDFGTGYSSLAYLKHLPIDKLKIDRSFIMDIPEDKDDMSIVETIIVLSKSLGMDIIAEGVETQEQKEFLIERGCTSVQGYLYSKPLSEEEMDTLVRLN